MKTFQKNLVSLIASAALATGCGGSGGGSGSTPTTVQPTLATRTVAAPVKGYYRQLFTPQNVSPFAIVQQEDRNFAKVVLGGESTVFTDQYTQTAPASSLDFYMSKNGTAAIATNATGTADTDFVELNSLTIQGSLNDPAQLENPKCAFDNGSFLMRSIDAAGKEHLSINMDVNGARFDAAIAPSYTSAIATQRQDPTVFVLAYNSSPGMMGIINFDKKTGIMLNHNQVPVPSTVTGVDWLTKDQMVFQTDDKIGVVQNGTLKGIVDKLHPGYVQQARPDATGDRLLVLEGPASLEHAIIQSVTNAAAPQVTLQLPPSTEWTPEKGILTPTYAVIVGDEINPLSPSTHVFDVTTGQPVSAVANALSGVTLTALYVAAGNLQNRNLVLEAQDAQGKGYVLALNAAQGTFTNPIGGTQTGYILGGTYDGNLIAVAHPVNASGTADISYVDIKPTTPVVSRETRVTVDPAAAYVAFSEDGRYAAFAAGAGQQKSIGIYDRTRRQTINNVAQGLDLFVFDVSDDGRYVTFIDNATQPSSTQSTYIADAQRLKVYKICERPNP